MTAALDLTEGYQLSVPHRFDGKRIFPAQAGLGGESGCVRSF
jgi:hypothetical protein